MKKMSPISIGKRKIGEGYPVYIIAEVGSNFDGDLERAKMLARTAKDMGADAYKIQNFLAPKIVSAAGFEGLKIAHQAKWDKPVVDVYKKAEFPREWVKAIAVYCKKIGIDFLSAPYDYAAVDLLESIDVVAYKIGAGEIDNLSFLKHVASKKKPIMFSAGACTLEEVAEAMKAIRSTGNNKIILLQCVTSYPAPLADSNINAMVEMGKKFGVQVGYSDHTVGHKSGGDDPLDGISVPMAAVALGARIIEKHFTDDRSRSGPDHPFALNIPAFSNMVNGIRAIEQALGDGKKRVMPSEKDTYIVQRRGVYAACDIQKGERLRPEMLEFLRPASHFRPKDLPHVLKSEAKRDIKAGMPITRADIR